MTPDVVAAISGLLVSEVILYIVHDGWSSVGVSMKAIKITKLQFSNSVGIYSSILYMQVIFNWLSALYSIPISLLISDEDSLSHGGFGVVIKIKDRF